MFQKIKVFLLLSIFTLLIAACAAQPAMESSATGDSFVAELSAPQGQSGQSQGQPPQIDMASAAAQLGVTEDALQAALGDPTQGPPDFAAAAQALGVTEADLLDALGIPAGETPPAESTTPAETEDQAAAAPPTQSAASDMKTFDITAGIQAAQWADGVTITLGADSFNYQSSGLPNHELPAKFLIPKNPANQPFSNKTLDDFNVVTTTEYLSESPIDVTLTLHPTYADEVQQTDLGAIGYTLSGARLFNDYENMERSVVALDDNITFTFDETGHDHASFVDECNGHPLADGSHYHYHGVPRCITQEVDTEGEHSHMIGVLRDGFPVYGNLGEDGVEVTNGDLDACSGHFGPTPEFPDGIYHYHLTEDEAPYSVDCYKGVVDPSTGDSQGNGGPPAGAGQNRPDFGAAAAQLGVTEEALQAALGDPTQGPPDFAAAAQALGITVEELTDALGVPAGGPQGGPPQGDQPGTPQASAPAAEPTVSAPQDTGAAEATTSSDTSTVSYPIVDTNQGICYNNSEMIDCPAAGEAFYGQDAQFTGNAPTYTDNGDGTITDNVTGLMWQQTPPQQDFTWQEAVDYCESLSLAGDDDWRLPNVKELFSINDFSTGWPYLDTRYFHLVNEDNITKDEQYWTSTKYAGVTAEGGSNAAFGVNHATGHIKAYAAAGTPPQGNGDNPASPPPGAGNNTPPASQGGDGNAQPPAGGLGNPFGKYARCVRGDTYGVNDFVDNGDGTITDQATGLMWTQDDSGAGMDWEDALTWVQQKNAENYLGYSDWRLPNVKELQSIVDYTRAPGASDPANEGPAIAPLFHISSITNEAGDADYPYFWTSTSARFQAGQPYYYAWYVAFGRAVNPEGVDFHGAGAARFDTKIEGGPAGEGGERYYNYVRLVRDADK